MNFINQTYLQISQNQNENLIDIENENCEDSNNEIKDHIKINQYLQKNLNIDRQEFFLRANEINNIDTVHIYEYSMNSGICWNCQSCYSHRCCSVCKKITSNCRCVFICGYTIPTGQKDKQGRYTQFQKCK